MKDITVNLSGELTVYHIFDILNAELNFTYAQPNWNSLDEALGTLDWLPQGSVVTVVIHRDISICTTIGTPDESEREFFFRVMINAYERNIYNYEIVRSALRLVFK